MSGFGDELKNVEGDAEKLAKEHPQQAEAGLDKAEQAASKGTGGRFDKELQEGDQKADSFMGQGQTDPSQQAPPS
jgi:vacuolar-type H+-ATPase subunit H